MEMSLMANAFADIVVTPEIVPVNTSRIKRGASKKNRRIVGYADPNAGPKVQRNASCPCGSGNKYKRCCINKEYE